MIILHSLRFYCFPLSSSSSSSFLLFSQTGYCQRESQAKTVGLRGGQLNATHPRRPRGSQSGREKGRVESFQVRAKEPVGTDSHRAISKNSSGCGLLIRYKKCFVLLCPIGEQFILSSFREFVHDGYCLVTHARFVHKACASKENLYFLLS